MTNFEETKKRALKILGNRNFSSLEMRKRLISKGESTENAIEAVNWLVEIGYIDDPKFATLIVRHYVTNGYGEARVKEELLRRGIPKEYWEEKLAEIGETELDDAANAFLAKKWRGNNSNIDMRRATESLIRRGFSFEDARLAVKRYLDSQETQE